MQGTVLLLWPLVVASLEAKNTGVSPGRKPAPGHPSLGVLGAVPNLLTPALGRDYVLGSGQSCKLQDVEHFRSLNVSGHIHFTWGSAPYFDPTGPGR